MGTGGPSGTEGASMVHGRVRCCVLIAVGILGVSAPNAFAAGGITGTVTGPGGAALTSPICVVVFDPDDSVVDFVFTNGAGQYTVADLDAGNYKVGFSSRPPCGGNYLDEFHNDKPDIGSADLVAVSDGTNTTVNAQLATGGQILGRVSGPSNQDLSGICVQAYQNDPSAAVRTTTTNGTGNYTLSGLATGSYKIRFRPCSAGKLLGEWHNDKQS